MAGPGGSAALPPDPAVVAVTMTEYAFGIEPELPAGRVEFHVVNQGSIDHALTLVVLPEDFPPLDEQARAPTGRGVGTLARLPRRGPGEVGTFAVDLVPGRYGLLCFVRDEAGEVHAAKGMNAEFVVKAPVVRAPSLTAAS